MARPISDEELQLKKRARRRLVGAIVLVSVAAVILPMVLDSEPKPVNQGVNIQIPSPDSGEYKPKKGAAPIDLAAGQKAKSGPDATPKSDAQAPAAKAEAASVAAIADPAPAPAAKDTGKTSSAKLDKSADKSKDVKAATKDTATPAADWVVQIGALADAAKARNLEQRVTSAGLKAYTEVVATQAGELTRVRAGLYPTREAAEKARAQLKKAGLDGKVVQK